MRIDGRGRICVRALCDMVDELKPVRDSFWDVLGEWGAKWMWENVPLKVRERNFDWLREGVTGGTLVWCADGSYKRKVAPDVCGVGWVVECRTSGERLEGSFYEISDDANAYRAEQLGICALHHVISAVSVFYGAETWNTKVGCDNEGAIKITRRRLKRIRPNMKCADILRNIRTARARMTTDPKYFHVYGHMDDYLRDDQLSLEQSLNKTCDLLAKGAVDLCCKMRSNGATRKHPQLLPDESAAVLVKGVKVTGDIADAVRFAKGMEDARVFLTKFEGWTEQQFEFVDWKNLHMALKSKPDAYKTWLSKQHSGFCGTRVQVGHYSGNPDSDIGCPNCGCDEKAEHLCICMDKDRTRLLTEMTSSLEVWLNRGGNTEPQLAYWIPKYVGGRGTIRFQDLGSMSPSVLLLAKEQDEIGWRNFMEGRISKRFCDIQSVFLADSSGYLNGRDWVKGFISRLLQITHSQWLFRNISLHSKEGGSMRKKKVEETRSEAELLASVNPVALQEESRFLLELDSERYVRGEGHYHDKVHWLSAMRAAVVAGRRRSRVLRRRTAGTVAAAEMMRREASRNTRRRVVAAVSRDLETWMTIHSLLSVVVRVRGG